MAALTAAEAPENSVTLLEKNDRILKKLLATGNGRCNLSSENASPSAYFGCADFSACALSEFTVKETLSFFESIGLITRTEYGGRIYPYSNSAASVVDVLRFALERRGVNVVCGCGVRAIAKKGGAFKLDTEKGIFPADKLVVACGGAASPKLGGTRSGYELLSSLGHGVTPLYPSLVQIKTDNTYPRALKGIKADALVSLLDSKGVFASARGEVLFTEYGLSGPVIFDLSRSLCGIGTNDVIVSLDLMPDRSESELSELIYSLSASGLPLEHLLTGVLGKKTGQAVIKYAGLSLSRADALSRSEAGSVALAAKHFEIKLTGTLGFETAQVTAGGARTDEFNDKTMESRLVPGLYAAGEVLDVDGRCGGYNLQWAWSSGRLAGRLL